MALLKFVFILHFNSAIPKMVRIRYLKLKELVDTYHGHLRSTPFHVEYPHGNLVKSRIVKTYGEAISFVDIVKVKGKFEGLLMYST